MDKRKKKTSDPLRTLVLVSLRDMKLSDALDSIISLVRENTEMRVENARLRGELNGMREGLGIRERGMDSGPPETK